MPRQLRAKRTGTPNLLYVSIFDALTPPPCPPASHTRTTQGAAPDVRADERAARLLAAHSMSISDMVQVLYPSLYSMHDLPPDVGDLPPSSPLPSAESPEGEASNGTAAARGVEGVWGRPRVGVDIPAALPPTSEKLSSEGVFLLDSGEELLMYVGRLVNAEVMLELFGVDAAGGEWQPFFARRASPWSVGRSLKPSLIRGLRCAEFFSSSSSSSPKALLRASVEVMFAPLPRA